MNYAEFPPGRAPSWSVTPVDSQQELDINFHENYFIHAIETQGAGDRDEWVTHFMLLYRLRTKDIWQEYRNSNGDRVVLKYFNTFTFITEQVHSSNCPYNDCKSSFRIRTKTDIITSRFISISNQT